MPLPELKHFSYVCHALCREHSRRATKVCLHNCLTRCFFFFFFFFSPHRVATRERFNIAESPSPSFVAVLVASLYSGLVASIYRFLYRVCAVFTELQSSFHRAVGLAAATRQASLLECQNHRKTQSPSARTRSEAAETLQRPGLVSMACDSVCNAKRNATKLKTLTDATSSPFD
jgi:hypothetical protein